MAFRLETNLTKCGDTYDKIVEKLQIADGKMPEVEKLPKLILHAISSDNFEYINLINTGRVNKFTQDIDSFIEHMDNSSYSEFEYMYNPRENDDNATNVIYYHIPTNNHAIKIAIYEKKCVITLFQDKSDIIVIMDDRSIIINETVGDGSKLRTNKRYQERVKGLQSQINDSKGFFKNVEEAYGKSESSDPEDDEYFEEDDE